MAPHKKLKNEYLYFHIQKWAFYFGKNACSTFPFLNVRVFCVVANRSQAFFVCATSVTHTFYFEEMSKMKKIISMILVLIFVFTLSACGNKDTSSNTDTSTPTQNETFVVPDNYVSVLLVTINPQFKLYLDENNSVLAVEPVNNDAKTFSADIDFENKSLETVIGTIVEKANKKGFVKENATVNFEIAEQRNETINKDDILQKAVSAAEKKAAELKITITAEGTNDTEKTESTNGNNSSNTSKPVNNTSKPMTSNENNTTSSVNDKNKHTHSYSSATCEEPQCCSCGATIGNALGHKWQEATCKFPQKCTVCGITNGEVGTHIIRNGICEFCKQPIAISPKNLDSAKIYWYHYIDEIGDFRYTFNDIVFTYSDVVERNIMTFNIIEQSAGIGSYGLYSPNVYAISDINDKFEYNGKTYYSMGIGGVGNGCSCKITEEEIRIQIADRPNDYGIFNLLSDGRIKVIFKTDTFHGNWHTEVGWIYTPFDGQN